MNNPMFLSFDYDFAKQSWNLPRGSVPGQLKSQGVPHALWMHFWDYAQSVVERAGVRKIMKNKLKMECENGNLSKHHKQERQTEVTRLDEQTTRDFECLQRQAERLFPNTRARVTKDSHNGEHFGLEIQLLHSNSSTYDIVHLHYDDQQSSWNLPREQVPTELAKHGVTQADWITIWDYGFGVNQRAKEREHLNELHERELQLCQKSLSYMNSTNIASVDQNAASSHNTTANHIRSKMEKLQRAKEANANNTKKGWQELQRRATQRFEPYGIKAYLSRPDNNQICCGLQFHCPKTVDPKRHQRKNPPTSSIWLPTPSLHTGGTSNDDASSSIPSVWSFAKEQFKTSFDHHSMSATPSPSPASTAPSADESVLRPKRNTEKENAPPRPETLLRKTKNSVWGHPVVLTFVHDESPSRIEVTTPLASSSYDDSFDEDSHGYVVPPAPSDPPSSIGSSSSGSMSGISSFKGSPSTGKKIKRVRFGPNEITEYESPYSKADRKSLWFTHEEREACRTRTKTLAQRVLDNRSNGNSHNVVFLDSETEEEVCWRGLEHAKKGNLSSRQETRRAFLVKVLEKQRVLRLNSFSNRRGAAITDFAAELREYASRQSRQCRERAQKFAAQDAKEARAVYKESLRKTNLYHGNSTSGSMSITSKCSSQVSYHIHHHDENGTYHQNDIFQDYCRQMHLASKARLQQAVV